MKKIFTVCAALIAAMTLSAQEPIVKTCAEAAAIALALPENNVPTEDVYSITGYVTNVLSAVSKGQQSFWMDDEKGDKKTFEGYWCNLPQEMVDANSPLNVGDKVKIVGPIMKYNTTPEMKNGDISIKERESQAPPVPEMGAPQVPTVDAANVKAIMCDKYENNLGWYPMGWGGCNWVDTCIAGVNFYLAKTMAWDCFASDWVSAGVAGYASLHFDIWFAEDGNNPVVKLEFNGTDPTAEITIPGEYKAGWNSVNVNVKDIFGEQPMNDLKCLTVKVAKEGGQVAWANILFFNGTYTSTEATGTCEETPVWPEDAPATAPAAPAHEGASILGAALDPSYAFEPLDWPGAMPQLLTFETGETIYYMSKMTWQIYTNWAEDYYDMSEYDMLHVDLYPATGTEVKISFEGLSVYDGGSGYKNSVVKTLTAGAWNGLDIALSEFPALTSGDSYDFSDIRYFILEGYNAEQTPLTIGNVYFYANETPVGIKFFDATSGLRYQITSHGNTNTVKVIRDDSYYYLTSITIPSSVTYNQIKYNVTEIESDAFAWCTSLTSVTIPNSVTTIGEWAFGLVNNIVYNGTATGSPWGAKCVNGYVDGYLVYSDATKTTLCGCSTAATGEITVPNSVITIGDEAFYNCTGLTSIVIGSSVAYIGESAFEYCENLRTVYNNSDLDIYAGSWNYGQVARYANKVYNGIPVGDFVIKRDTILTAYIGTATNVTIPNYITEIRYDAFYGCTGLTSVIIECTLSNGSSEVFRYCPITSVTIGEEVQYLPYDLFGYYEDEKHITSVTWNAKNCSTQYSSGSSIFGKQVKSFVFGNNVKVIPSYCCRDMTNLTSMVIPNSVDSVGSRAFYGCTGLTAPVYNANCFAYMPTSYIGAYIVPQGIKQIACGAFYGCTGLTSVEIPNSATTIGEGAFLGCTSLTSVTIPNSVTSIGGEAFDDCTSITNITAPAIYFDVSEGLWLYHSKQLTSVVVNSGELTENELLYINRSYKTLKTLDVSAVTNTEFADEAFEGCYNLESIVLPQSLERIGYMMVAGCKNLKSIDIPASVVEIDQSAFEDCRSIKTITFNGNQLKTIGNWAFYNAHQLQNLALPEGVEEIGEGAFYGCVYMEDLMLPRSTKSIGDNTFALCSKLNKITVCSLVPPTIAPKTFYDVKRQIPVYVPIEAVDAYKQADYWKEFNIVGIEMPTDLESVHGSQCTMHKYFHNGNLIIERNGIKYTPAGQKVR